MLPLFGHPTTNFSAVRNQVHLSEQTALNEALLQPVVPRTRRALRTSKKKGSISDTQGRFENFSAVRNQVHLSVTKELQEQTSDVELSSKEAQRMKLCQYTHHMMPEQNAKVDRHSKLRQNSNAIETDSENVSLTTSRPVTRALARNKPPTGHPTTNFKPKTSSLDKEAKQCDSISSSAKKPMPSQSCAVSRGCLTTEHTDGAKKSCATKSGDLLLHSTGLKNIQPVAIRDETPTPAKELPLQEDHDDCSDYPLFKMTGFILNSSPPHGSPPKAGPSIADDKCVTMSNSATENNNNSGSSDNKAIPDDRYPNANDSFIEEKNAVDGPFTPCIGETDSTEEVSSMKRGYMDVQASSNIELVEKPIVFWNKHRSQVDIDDVSPVFSIPKAGGKPDDIFMEASEENADNGLRRLAVEQAKRKMAWETKRTCLDVLMSTSEEIHSDLQDVECQIQADVRKLTRKVTFKRKQLQSRLQEKQELLKVTHDYIVVVEGMEAQLVEVKGAIEAQKISERKLISQAEAAVEKHITNAHRNIKSACTRRLGNMQQLQVAIIKEARFTSRSSNYMDVQTSSNIELVEKPIVFWNKHRSQVDIDDVLFSAFQKVH
ncbi:uncharacterized protein LOC141592841 isoform X2 [Silene latifolia]|uniref:uncharacterized protein LOC141592841 isoform X2 n=1 Tax=Silene latifolia TaxID=37657 RepID=UPI003D7788F6